MLKLRRRLSPVDARYRAHVKRDGAFDRVYPHDTKLLLGSATLDETRRMPLEGLPVPQTHYLPLKRVGIRCIGELHGLSLAKLKLIDGIDAEYAEQIARVMSEIGLPLPAN